MLKISKPLVCATVFLLPFFAWCQIGTADDLIPPEGVRPRTFEDFLVQTAWLNHPSRSFSDQKIKVAKLEVNQQKKGWMEQVSGNLGFNSLRDTVSLLGTQYLAPGFNYGVSFSIGSLLTNKSKVKVAEGKVKLEEFSQQELKLNLRKEVLYRYQKYKLSVEILKARKQAEEDALSKYTLISELFQSNKASFEEYNEASISYHSAREKRLTTETDIRLAVIDLEEILGARWENIERNRARYEKN